MVTVGITKAITNLNEAHAKLGIFPVRWLTFLPSGEGRYRR